MEVMDALHKEVLAEPRQGVRMSVPQAIHVAASFPLIAKFGQRPCEVALLQVFDDAMAGNAVEESERMRWLARAVGQEMEMLRHHDIGKNRETARTPRFIQAAQTKFLSSAVRNTGSRSWATLVMKRLG